MAFLITDSAQPLLLETVPVLKLTQSSTLTDITYAYFRGYFYAGTLHYSVTAFCETPKDGTHFFIRIGAPHTENTLAVSLATDGMCNVTLHTDDGEAVLQNDTAKAVFGADEQGAYWSVTHSIDADTFAKAFGNAPKAGDVLLGNVFLCDGVASEFSCAYDVPAGTVAPCTQGAGVWTVVPY